MQNLISAILSMLVLAQSFSVSLADFLHIPDLVTHYEYHQEHFGDDLLSFIEKHYGELKEEHRQEHEGHDKLPSGHQHSCAHSAVVFLNTQQPTPEHKSIPADQTSANYFYRDNYHFAAVSGIFQPPKNV
ncbi:MAG: hypothetical protein COA80_10050 [Leeuwenhoekiella sp.]|nr:MAG: hypothetical protein COA80_10050 [Leeuwenhoekiella sp.]